MRNSSDNIASTDSLLERLSPTERTWFLFRKLFEYLVRYADNPRYLFLYLSRIFVGSYYEKVHFMNDTDFLEEAKRRSTIRIGDGEFGLLLGKRGLYFQKNEPVLRDKLFTAITEYSNESRYILGIPPFISIPNEILHRHNFKYLWMPSKVLFKILFPKEANYFNAVFFYIDNTILPFLHAFSAEHDIVVVTNKDNIDSIKQRQSFFFPQAPSVTYVETPAKDAFAIYDSLVTQIVSSTRTLPRPVVFMACGPAGKAMIYDLSKEQILAHDLGHSMKFAALQTSQEHQIRWDIFKKYWRLDETP